MKEHKDVIEVLKRCLKNEETVIATIDSAIKGRYHVIGKIDKEFKQALSFAIGVLEKYEHGCPICKQRNINNQMGYSNQHPQKMKGQEI